MRKHMQRRWLMLPCFGAAALGWLAELPAVAATPDRVDTEPQLFVGEAGILPATPPAPYSPADRERRLAEKGMTAGSPVMIRIFKQESELELWVETQGRFELFATYPVCFWSGTLGPKLREGDRQAPEGFYSIGLHQLYPRGRRPRSFDIGFPNSFDRAFARTGSYIFVHGGCTSIGCFAMTDPIMDEIYALTERALREGQDRIQIHVFPFRMTEANLAAHADSAWSSFWSTLKPAYDLFESTRVPPRVSVCARRYIVRDGSAPAETAPPPDNGAPTAFGICEDSIEGIVHFTKADGNGEDHPATHARRVASRPHGRHVAGGRNVRANYAAARRARMAAHARRMAHR